MDKLEKFSRIFKITLLRWLFSKMVSNLWFLKNLQGIFHIKLKAIFFNGISFENWRRFQKKIKGISFVKFYPRASLARAVFSFKTFFDCEWFVKLKPRRNCWAHVEENEMGMCKIKGEEMRWIRMEPSYTELDYSFTIDGYWKF